MINIYLSDNNLYCAGKPFFAGFKSKGVVSIPRQYQENHERARGGATALRRVTGARGILPPSRGYPAVARRGKAGAQQRLEDRQVIGHCQQHGLVAFTVGENLCDMRVNGLCEPGLVCGQRHKGRVSCSTRLSSTTDGSGYYSSAMRLRPYLANRSLIASTRRAWVVRSCWIAINLNFFAASGTTWAAINCRRMVEING